MSTQPRSTASPLHWVLDPAAAQLRSPRTDEPQQQRRTMQETTRAPQHAAQQPRITPEPGFAEAGISAPVVRALAMRGIDEPFAIQSLVIPDAMAGRDVLARSRTGSGKTLAFAAPIVERIVPDRRSPIAPILVPRPRAAAQAPG